MVNNKQALVNQRALDIRMVWSAGSQPQPTEVVDPRLSTGHLQLHSGGAIGGCCDASFGLGWKQACMRQVVYANETETHLANPSKTAVTPQHHELRQVQLKSRPRTLACRSGIGTTL